MLSKWKVLGTAAAVVIMTGLASRAQATLLIDFEQGSTAGGTISQNGGIITGTNIKFDVLKYCTDGTDPSTCSFYDLTGNGSADGNGAALLNFTTGPNGGNITLTGGVVGEDLGPNDNDIPDVNGPIDLIQSGTFDSASLGSCFVASCFVGSGLDVKNPTLLGALGIDPNTSFGFTTFELGLSNVDGQLVVSSADISNVPVPVPEPGSMFLLGSGLIAASRAFRKRLGTKKAQ